MLPAPCITAAYTMIGFSVRTCWGEVRSTRGWAQVRVSLGGVGVSCIANGAELLYCRLSGLQAKLCLAQGRRTAELAIANMHVCPHLSTCWHSLC